MTTPPRKLAEGQSPLARMLESAERESAPPAVARERVWRRIGSSGKRRPNQNAQTGTRIPVSSNVSAVSRSSLRPIRPTSSATTTSTAMAHENDVQRLPTWAANRIPATAMPIAASNTAPLTSHSLAPWVTISAQTWLTISCSLKPQSQYGMSIEALTEPTRTSWPAAPRTPAVTSAPPSSGLRWSATAT